MKDVAKFVSSVSSVFPTCSLSFNIPLSLLLISESV